MIPNVAATPVAVRNEDRRAAYRVAKRALDIALSLVGLVLLAPVFVLLALLVRLDSRGPALHRRRVAAQQPDGGISGGAPLKTFDAFKFRTMREDADAVLARDPELRRAYEVGFKLADDPRVTRLGRLLRRTCLDELPQLVNVLRGEMSLVGPRIATPEELERFGAQAAARLSVPPGLTGLWQISGRPEPRYPERVRLDLEYIARRSFGLDLLILARTVLWLFSPRRNP
jgi:Sugar transferases involved in lipopolysaccharide synthesis